MNKTKLAKTDTSLNVGLQLLKHQLVGQGSGLTI